MRVHCCINNYIFLSIDVLFKIYTLVYTNVHSNKFSHTYSHFLLSKYQVDLQSIVGFDSKPSITFTKLFLLSSLPKPSLFVWLTEVKLNISFTSFLPAMKLKSCGVCNEYKIALLLFRFISQFASVG